MKHIKNFHTEEIGFHEGLQKNFLLIPKNST